MAEFGLGMLAQVFLQLLPEAAVISNLFARCANWDQAAEHLHFLEGLLQFFIAAAKFNFSIFAAVHFLF